MSVPQLQPIPLNVRYIRSPDQIPGLSKTTAESLNKVVQKYAFRATDYYLDLIDWNDPADPIRRLIVPDPAELRDWGRLDASDEAANTVARGVQHKYRDTALVLTAATCAAYCRYCFRKRLFMRQNEEIARDLNPAFLYVEQHPEITDVLLTGGDPLILNTARLQPIVERFAAMPHVRTIRIGSKIPAFNPQRIIEDERLLNMVQQVTSRGTALYLMAHFDHPRELTDLAREGIKAMQDAGAHVLNQCPMVRGVNDDADVLTELFQTMTELGAAQYYLFQCRPTAGNAPFEVPLVEAWQTFDRARRQCSGLARQVRYAMSHTSGKIEVLGIDRDEIWMRYHRAKDPVNESRVMRARRDDAALWFDDLELVP